jgi:hypothetical protein
MANDKLLVARLDDAAEVLQSLGSYCIDTSSQGFAAEAKKLDQCIDFA